MSNKLIIISILILGLLLLSVILTGCHQQTCVEFKETEVCLEYEYYDSPCPSKLSVRLDNDSTKNEKTFDASFLCMGKTVILWMNESQTEEVRILEYNGTQKLQGKCIHSELRWVCAEWR